MAYPLPHAVFVIAAAQNKYKGFGIAAVRRHDGGLGLPGGKVEASDRSSRNALLRETLEEGWDIDGGDTPFVHSQLVGDKTVHWFFAPGLARKTDVVDVCEVSPEIATIDEIAASGMGNDSPTVVAVMRAAIASAKWEAVQ